MTSGNGDHTMLHTGEGETGSSLNGSHSHTDFDGVADTGRQPTILIEKDIETGDLPSTRGLIEAPVNVTAISDWDGPHDPHNPQNWSLRKRVYYVFSPAVLGFSVSIASSLITPGTDLIAKEFNVSFTAAILTLSLYALGLGLGPALAAGPSETFGRAIVYKVSFFIFMLFTLGAGYSHTFAALLVTRFFAGIFAGPTLAIGAGTMADVFPPHTRAYASTAFVVAPFLGPVLGPLIGGYAVAKGWRWTQWCTLFIAVVSFLFALPMEETYKRVILERKAKKLGLRGPPKLGPQELLPSAKFFLQVTLLRPMHMLFTEPLVAFTSMYTAFCFALLFAYFAAFPYVFGTVYGFSVGQTGLTFIGLGAGVLLAAATITILNRTVFVRKHQDAIKAGRPGAAPEQRLYSAMLGSFGIPISLFWFGWSARPDVHWIVPIVAGICFGWGNLCIFASCILFLIDVYGPLNGASSAAANGIARYTAGAVFPLFTIQMYERLGIGWASSLLGFISIAMLPIPWAFFYWGPAIRAKSQYPTSAL